MNKDKTIFSQNVTVTNNRFSGTISLAEIYKVAPHGGVFIFNVKDLK